MPAVWRVVRAEARRRWVSWLALAGLVALVGGTVLAGVSSARRTEAALPDYLSKYGYDAELYATNSKVPTEVAHLKYVSDLATAPFYITGNGAVYADGVVRGPGQYLSSNPTLIMPLTPEVVDKVARIASGRAPVGVDEVDVGYAMQQQFHLKIGSLIVLPFYAASQAQEVYSSSGTPPTHGPTPHFRVVGVAASVVDFPVLTPSYTIYVSPAFARRIGPHTLTGLVGFVRLKHSGTTLPRFEYDINHLPDLSGFAGAQGLHDQLAAVANSIHPQAVGWWLFALLAALAGIALVGQALWRQSVEARELHPALSAIGLGPTPLFAIGVARAAFIGLGGAIGALAIAAAVSPLTPVGEARVAEPSSGVTVDPVVFALGGLGVMAIVVILGCVPAWRDAQVSRLRRQTERLVGTGGSRIATAAARAGAPPTVVIGIRHALERGRGRTSVPVATALVGTVVAVGALVATSVFGSSLGELLSTPRLYGQDFQVVVNSLTGPQVRDAAARLEADPSVEGLTYAITKVLTVNDVSVDASIVVAAKGRLVIPLAAGKYPTDPRELALGTETLREAGATVGSTVVVSVIGPAGKAVTRKMVVSGSVVFAPAISNGGGLGSGALVMLPTALDFICGVGTASDRCRAQANERLNAPNNNGWGMAARVAPGAAGLSVVRTIERRFSGNLTPLAVPTNLANFGQAVNFPLLLGCALAVFGVATLEHLLLVSASRRRREFALLKVLGFLRSQIRASVSWQAGTVALIGVVFGVPLGVVVGTEVWQAFASNLGVVPLTVVSLGAVGAIVAGVVVISVTLAVAPAIAASRTRPAFDLREE
jgi:ABC-type lipoprotein release transport system permease subunit